MTRTPRTPDPRRINPLSQALHNYVVIDTETTGLDPFKGSRLLEIGAVRIHHDTIVDTFTTMVNPHTTIPPHITALTGIADHMTVNAPNPEDALQRLTAWLHEDDVLMAHNAAFDMSFLDKTMRDTTHNRQRFFPHLFLDTLEMSRRLHPERRSHSVASLIRAYRVGDVEQHRALSDALQEERLYRKMRAEAFPPADQP